MSKVRIVNTKTGDVKYVTPQIANNEKMLKSYEWIVQDFKEKRQEKETPVTPFELLVTEPNKFEPEAIEDKSLEELKAEYKELTGRMAGNKKAETIAKEIQEIKEKAKSNI